jgi:hypothetical protein
MLLKAPKSKQKLSIVRGPGLMGGFQKAVINDSVEIPLCKFARLRIFESRKKPEKIMRPFRIGIFVAYVVISVVQYVLYRW